MWSDAKRTGSIAALVLFSACVEDLRFFVDAGHAPRVHADADSLPSQPDEHPACKLDLSALLPPTAAARTCGSALFRYALCSCADINAPLPLTTDAFDSRLASYAPGMLGGSIATNGRLSTAAALDIGGSIIASGHGRSVVFAGASSRVADYMRLNTDLSINTAELSVQRDLWVNGRILNLNGALHVGRQISQPNASDNQGEIAAAQGLRSDPVQIDPACACIDDSTVDFTQLADHFAARSDNAAHDLQPDALAADTLTWPCGRFIFPGGSTAATRWMVSERAAVFVEGDLELSKPLQIDLAAQAELDVFVHGSLRFGEAAELTTTRPGGLRVYVSGSDPILLPLGARFNCSLYAPNALLRVRDQSEISGAFSVSELVTSSALTIHFDAAAASAVDSCSTSCAADSDCTPPWVCDDGQCLAVH